MSMRQIRGAVSVYRPHPYPPQPGADEYTRSVLHESSEFCLGNPNSIAVDPLQ